MRTMQQPPATARTVVFTLVLAAGVLLGVGLGPGTLPAAGAAPCDGDAVTVIVDPGPLGGSLDGSVDGSVDGGVEQGVEREVEQRCVAGAGGLTAVQIAEQAGFELDFVPGTTFVCRVGGRPGPDRESCGRTPPNDAYWGLFWAADTGAPWTYATLGATALTVPDGGRLGWRWQDGGDRDEPPAPGAATGRPAGGSAAEETQPADAAGTDEAGADEAGDGEAGAVPAWAAGGAVLLLAGAVGAIAWRRRRGA